MLKKQAHGKIKVTSIVSKDPIKAITKPKKGTERATNRVERTSVVLIMIAYKCDFDWFDGINSSKLSAKGVRVNAYLVIGFTTVVHTVTLEATRLCGMLRVNCDCVDSPNIV